MYRGQTALHKACTFGSTIIVEMLIETALQMHGQGMVEDLLRTEDIEGNTPLLLAVESGSPEIARCGNITQPRANILIHASLFNRLLLRYPVDINHENRNKMRALHLAAKIGNYECVKLLIGKNAVINCRNNNYRTPMMMACLFTHEHDKKGR